MTHFGYMGDRPIASLDELRERDEMDFYLRSLARQMIRPGVAVEAFRSGRRLAPEGLTRDEWQRLRHWVDVESWDALIESRTNVEPHGSVIAVLVAEAMREPPSIWRRLLSWIGIRRG